MHSNTVIVDIQISAEEYQKMYAGTAKNVLCVARDGRRIRFPAPILRPFVTRQGISGAFQIYFDQNNKFVGIDRLA
ncbi:DUF2835 domain-containing protein [Teredinibacter sp. KSP-S5-2]|uniref:DUF2835 domain-containing protein n=1 Tax=Teredinibacter sp. KSP-S5-2 TaxID=3034506 RepID=UPI002934D0D8|nr:DUF2835 domain-containing protein [Teredinibacter sp. KSP-S5-2]WNO07636.1 DUF2835 domain-containing protein [Teredinibacter sp. KSP-S5-2]